MSKVDIWTLRSVFLNQQSQGPFCPCVRDSYALKYRELETLFTESLDEAGIRTNHHRSNVQESYHWAILTPLHQNFVYNWVTDCRRNSDKNRILPVIALRFGTLSTVLLSFKVGNLLWKTTGKQLAWRVVEAIKLYSEFSMFCFHSRLVTCCGKRQENN